MTTNPSSKKTENMLHNPRVSLLVHDWVSHRPPTTSVTTGPAATEPERTASPPPPVARSSLAALLLNLNTSALSSISATINGTARLVERGTDEEAFYKEAHLRNNTFGEGGEDSGIGQGSENTYQGDGGRGCFIEGEEVMVVVVKVESGRIADWKGAVRDWEVVGAEEAVEEQHSRRSMVNGI
ncbi:MAG: hypothetical protein M1814_005199 [Vezdaea aestivalis]|nr:MAG: hypothetical protein M1814_005199 [Vezdaea aestivalis]